MEWRPVVLVPLDGSRGSEAVLPTAQNIALERGARIRLLHVVPSVESARARDNRMMVYADQESARVVHEVRGSLRGPHGALGNLDVEEIVRFGVPAEEILREAEARDVVAVVMAAHRRTWPRRLLRRSVSRRVERAAWVPVMLTRYGAEVLTRRRGATGSSLMA
jgi:nucleotide-binding universal stress UspA family protein